MRRTDDIDSRRLRSIIALAQSPSLGSAARSLHMSVSGLRYQLEQLEQEIGVQLFLTAGPAGPALTASGKTLAAGAIDILGSLDELVDRVRRMDSLPGRTLRVVAPWPVVLGLLRTGEPAPPDHNWKVSVAQRESALKIVGDGDADVAIAADWTGDTCKPTGLVVTELFRASYLLAVSSENLLSRRASIDVRETSDHVWVNNGVGGAQQFFDMQLAGHQLKPETIVAADALEYMALIETNRAIGLAEPILRSLVRPGTRLVPLRGMSEYRYFAAHPHSLGQDAGLSALLSHVRETGRRSRSGVRGAGIA